MTAGMESPCRTAQIANRIQHSKNEGLKRLRGQSSLLSERESTSKKTRAAYSDSPNPCGPQDRDAVAIIAAMAKSIRAETMLEMYLGFGLYSTVGG